MTTERKPHKWAEVIKAWADGKEIQFKRLDHKIWTDYLTLDVPNFNDSSYEWRIKPRTIIIEESLEVWERGIFKGVKSCLNEKNIRLEFDADTKKLVKAEVIG